MKEVQQLILAMDPGLPSTERELYLKAGAMYTITQKDRDVYAASFPHLDLDIEFAKMVSWTYSASEGNKKTPKGVKKFMNHWLSGAKSTNTSDVRFNRAKTSTRDSSLEADLTNRGWAT